MTLQQKFALLVGMLALAVLGSVAAAWWSTGLLRGELAIPFASTSSVLDGLGHIKRGIDREADVIAGTVTRSVVGSGPPDGTPEEAPRPSEGSVEGPGGPAETGEAAPKLPEAEPADEMELLPLRSGWVSAGTIRWRPATDADRETFEK